MDENCYVEPAHKKVTVEEYQNPRMAWLVISGMGCPNCAGRVRNSLIALYGVTEAIVDHIDGVAEVSFNPRLVSPEALIDAVAGAGNDGRHSYAARYARYG